MPLLTRTFTDRPPFRVFEVPVGRSAATSGAFDADAAASAMPRRSHRAAAAQPTPSTH